jgi:hypothetical protein
MVRSLERYDGVRIARDASGHGAPDRDQLDLFAAMQRAAVTLNARRAAELIERILRITEQLNAAWRNLSEQASAPQFTGPQQPSNPADVRREAISQVTKMWELSEDEVAILEKSLHGPPAVDASPSRPRRVLCDQGYVDGMRAMAERLEAMIQAYGDAPPTTNTERPAKDRGQ